MTQGILQPWKSDGGAILLVVAALPEIQAIAPDTSETYWSDPWRASPWRDGIDLVCTGVGKANAAAGTARAIDPSRHRLVVSLGLGGALPRTDQIPLSVGSVVAGTQSLFADEGVRTPGGFLSMGDLGLLSAASQSIKADQMALEAVLAFVDDAGPIATVSTGSGTDALAMEVALRSAAVVEAMEGAAVGAVAAQLGIGFLELRVVSNYTGDRDRQRWEIPRALARMGELARSL